MLLPDIGLAIVVHLGVSQHFTPHRFGSEMPRFARGFACRDAKACNTVTLMTGRAGVHVGAAAHRLHLPLSHQHSTSQAQHHGLGIS
jgi:hypothetical protein